MRRWASSVRPYLSSLDTNVRAKKAPALFSYLRTPCRPVRLAGPLASATELTIMPATERDRQVAKRYIEIMLSLRAKYFEDRCAGRPTETGIPVAAVGTDAITRAAVRSLTGSRYAEIVDGFLRFAGSGFNEAFKIEEGRNNLEVSESERPTQAGLFQTKAGE
jgi:hypothetical protein